MCIHAHALRGGRAAACHNAITQHPNHPPAPLHQPERRLMSVPSMHLTQATSSAHSAFHNVKSPPVRSHTMHLSSVLNQLVPSSAIVFT